MNKGDKLNSEEILLRRVYRKDKRYINPQTGRPVSRAFSPSPKDSGKLSVNIERLTTYEKSVVDSIKFTLFKFPASLAFELGLDCIYDPIETPEEYNPAHSLIIGIDSEDESIPGILARKAVEVVYP